MDASPEFPIHFLKIYSTLLSAKFSWSNSLRSWFHGSRDKICATFNMPRSAPETLNNGEQSLDFTYYEQTTNRFGHLI